MAYCTVDELKDQMPATELLQLVDDEKLGTLTTASTARLTAAIEDSSSLIDGSARKGGYAVPLTDTAFARRLCKQLAICQLLHRKNLKIEVREKDCDDAAEQLKALAKGEVVLSTAANKLGVERDDRENVFSADNLESF
jgi:phage gp36-like protein